MTLNFDDENQETIISNNDNLNQNNSVDALLPLDEDRVKPTECENELEKESTEDDDEEENPAAVQTKHDFVTSPWSRLGIIGGAFGVGFLLMFVVLNSMINGGSNTAQTPVATSNNTPTSAPFEEKDGDAYAKLALQKQQQELEALNGKEKETKKNNTEGEETPDGKNSKKQIPNANTPALSTTTQARVTSQETPPPPRSYRVYREANPETEYNRPRRSAVLASRPIEPLRPTATLPKITLPVSSKTTKAAPSSSESRTETQKDPIAELERLRSLGNVGRVEYGNNTDSTTIASSRTEEEVPSDNETPRRRNRRGENTVDITPNSTPNNTGEVEELRPRWEPTNAVEFTTSKSKQAQLSSINYLTEEAQILEERQTQYLVVGSSTSATLVTPLILTQGSTNSNLRFVARLDEPIKSNTGGIALSAGTQVAIALISVDSGFNITAEVIAILKDGTEYPISPGAISILGKGNNPLIARPYKDKGGEIALFDTTLGTIAGLAKVGEIINRQDQTTEDLPFGGSRTRTTGNNRDITGAFLEGAFGKLSETITSRTQQATSEITSRPNIWYVPAYTKISILVNRSIKL
ncbi:TrbI/VirB10 family protein [Scytonema hofmannii FACHB-248]|uniref:TrbI/VirB10 family protein n=1 Tax=Scytonema hofmannii FACHB-248 TaxID=1842502 RepID=A0ABR8GMB1_9CYAN|nr:MULTISPECIES: TrbI/VirB10 family protein [Nostocales]MBD2604071.1 TrbI/VirB10 family protein [Scytonema hofmannii FACHB-248]